MYSVKSDGFKDYEDIQKVINSLCDDTVLELKEIFGKNYKQQVEIEIMFSNINIIRLKENNQPVGLFGLTPVDLNTVGIYLLTTDDLHKGNVITFLKEAKKQIKQWQKDYKLILDNCYKDNKTIKKWLKLLGFKPSQYQDDKFQIYYLGDISLYQ